jgi:hypothetical protein
MRANCKIVVVFESLSSMGAGWLWIMSGFVELEFIRPDAFSESAGASTDYFGDNDRAGRLMHHM